jgi:plastocyanin
MKRLLLVALATLLVTGLYPSASGAQGIPSQTIIVGGGTPLSNGIFFPGTAIYDGSGFVGEPVSISQGTDLEVVNLDEEVVANSHKLVSLKLNKRTKRPLFSSQMLRSPGDSSAVVTSHLKPGTYPFYCPVHSGMWGLLEVQ